MGPSQKVGELKKMMQQLVVEGKAETELFRQMSKAAAEYKNTLNEVDKAIRESQTNIENANKSKREILADKIGDKLGGFTQDIGLGDMSGILSSAAKTITNPYVAVTAGAVAAGKAFYDYNVELDRSIKKTEEFTGKTGNELYSLRNGIKATADTFGKEFDEVLSTVDALVSEYGIDAEDANDLVADGFISGSDEAGNLLDMISKYKGAFHDAGIGADELVAIIGNTRSGIFGEEGMDMIAKGGIRLRKMSKEVQESLEGIGISADEMKKKIGDGSISSAEAIKMIAKRIKELGPNSQEATRAINGIFDDEALKAGHEEVAALAEVETNIEKVKEQTGEWGVAMSELMNADRELENALASLFGTSHDGFSLMTTQLKTEVFKAISTVINRFIDMYNKCLLVRVGVETFSVAFKIAWDIIKTVCNNVFIAISAMSDALESLFNLDWEGVKNAWTGGVKSLLLNVADMFDNMWDDIKDGGEHAINNRIEKINTVEETTITETNNKEISKGKTNKKDNNKSKKESKKTEKTIDYEEGSLEYENKKLSELQDKLKKVDASNLEKVAELEKQISVQQKKVDNIKKVYDFEFNLNIKGMSISDLEKEINKVDEVLKSDKFKDKNIDRKIEIKNEIKEDEIELPSDVSQMPPVDVERYINIINKVKEESPNLELPDDISKWSKEDLNLYKKILVDYQTELLNNSVAGIAHQISKIDERLQKEVLTPEERESLKVEKRIKVLAKAELEGSLNEKTINGISNIISDLQDRLNIEELTIEQRIEILREIEVKTEMKDKMENPNLKEGSISWINQQINKKQAEIEIEIVGSDKWKQLSQEIADLENKKHNIEVEIEQNKVLNSQEQMQQMGDAITGIGTAFNNVGNAMSSLGEDEAIAKSALIAQAVGQLAVSFAGAMKGTFTPWDWIAGATSGAAVLTSLIASMQKFADGGIVQGSALLGDHMLARVNPGEMILNGTQQSHLFDAIDKNRFGGGQTGGQVEFKIDGQVIKGVLNNVSKKLNRQS